MSEKKFKIKSKYSPAGDQPNAISLLVEGLDKGYTKQTLLGATGTGKTFTIANVIEKVQKTTLVIAHNKTLAAQLAQEFAELFPENAVHYFVSYYDYYQPEAYMPISDTYIEKDASINAEIDRLRHMTTQSLLTRKDVIIVASVSCIYGLGSPEEYLEQNLLLEVGVNISRRDLLAKLVSMQYERTNTDLKGGSFRSIGNKIDIMPVQDTRMYSLTLKDNVISEIHYIDPVSSVIVDKVENAMIFPAKHFMTDDKKREIALKSIEQELKERLIDLKREGKLLEHERLKRRTNYDMALIKEVGYTSGIENYSRHFSGKKEGEAPDTLLSYFPHDNQGSPDFLTVIDESHVTLPQLRAMYAGDQARKKTLVDFGFRLPSAKDNRPLRFEEFQERVGQAIYVSATPAEFERQESQQIVEQVIRPTGLLDPIVTIKPVTPTEDTQVLAEFGIKEKEFIGQIQDFINEAEKEIKNGGRVIATTLTKKMAEDLSAYLKERSIKTEYLHSDVKTIERIEILSAFRRGDFDCIVGVNLLREGLDLPEVTFIGILDADKEGFLRSETSLIQTIGRAARNSTGRVTLYADRMTGSIERALDETNRRRDIQIKHNKKNGITPITISKTVTDITKKMRSDHVETVLNELEIDLKAFDGNIKKLISYKKEMMTEAVKELDFETAAILRDEILELEYKLKQGK